MGLSSRVNPSKIRICIGPRHLNKAVHARQPVAYASRALTDCQKKYAQIEKELLAIVFGCDKFHDYIYGRTVTKTLSKSSKDDAARSPCNCSFLIILYLNTNFTTYTRFIRPSKMSLLLSLIVANYRSGL